MSGKIRGKGICPHIETKKTMTRLLLHMSFVVHLLLAGTIAHAYQLSAFPASVTEGDTFTVTLTGVLDGVNQLNVRIGYSESLNLQVPVVDPVEFLDPGVAGAGDAFATLDPDVAPFKYFYSAVAFVEPFSVDGAILNVGFDALAAGVGLVTFSTCALPVCDLAQDYLLAETSIQIRPKVGVTVPEPGSLALALTTLLITWVGLGKRRRERS